MTKQNRKPAVPANRDRRDVRELTAEELQQVSGGGLLSSPVGFTGGLGIIGNPPRFGGPGTVVTP